VNNIIKFLLLIISLSIISCSEKVSYSGKIFNFNQNINDFKTKEDVTSNLGSPNFIDPIEKKYIYFSEKRKSKNFFNNEIVEAKLIVFQFNDSNIVKFVQEYDLDNQNKIDFIKENTKSEIIETGLIEKIFGGVGKGTTPINQ